MFQDHFDQGIGRSLALAMANKGMTVIASARNTEALQQLSDECAGLYIFDWFVKYSDQLKI